MRHRSTVEAVTCFCLRFTTNRKSRFHRASISARSKCLTGGGAYAVRHVHPGVRRGAPPRSCSNPDAHGLCRAVRSVCNGARPGAIACRRRPVSAELRVSPTNAWGLADVARYSSVHGDKIVFVSIADGYVQPKRYTVVGLSLDCEAVIRHYRSCAPVCATYSADGSHPRGSSGRPTDGSFRVLAALRQAPDSTRLIVLSFPSFESILTVRKARGGAS